ncbi:hypothetical protein Nocox_18280 [Nonomuraea coxensis DSM 45129]|uniref:DUF222 domain-containing protein n=1 Tax=Nonomuraea coxensis DSM 45129 TaxID=1122611 RepID=A0ABX8U0N6_9ACTN|nr:hypothetical protein [Nonomuraea coxensis]QYC41265.1 hypothetical protein Nocox_18280 [Nonomuraea coxensis DSM 45129]
MDNHLEHLPILSRGRHRNPKRGACFMELASYLAGERWSDHPACTHPLLAALARLVNDNVDDENRAALVPLVPSIIGLTGDDLRVDARIALRCATTALPVAAAERQLALAVSVLAAEEMLARLDGAPPGRLSEASRRALDEVPHAREQARRFSRAAKITEKGFRRYAAPNAVQLAVVGIVQACVNDPDALLRRLLEETIADCAAMLRGTPPTGDTLADLPTGPAGAAVTPEAPVRA